VVSAEHSVEHSVACHFPDEAAQIANLVKVSDN
jgi:hypothetical protein